MVSQRAESEVRGNDQAGLRDSGVAIQVAYAPPVRKIHNFLVCDFSVVIGLGVKPSGCANIFVN